ncbi:tetratricopeptide repeat protein [Kitasatospora purpeofusca]|uniref:tetratricopeptide repeat protein n=1 Tax=Kitasatospora purpeofusca TaxID=67352 RepID=UPI002259C40B|nr:tetratricopeptide repeat protein [Kitasatospora purpeofusca]MCX4753125.1 tetratricopeptide repeat protein [Kitasatospora purpeofusca]WSR32651.1 tetratricopeptide repeat protein [Kitasatospora purpeofusca]WSR40743.1 tetratricopeptide repeat protein [Kitasatospora purpeofusca]
MLGLPTTEHRAIVELGVLVTGFLSYRNRPDETLGVAQRTLQVAQAADEPRLVSAASFPLSSALHMMGRTAAATETLYRASGLLRGRDDLEPDIRVLRQHGLSLMHTGRFEEGVEVLTRALTACREQGNRFEEAHVLRGLSIVLELLGRTGEAADALTGALKLYKALGLDSEADAVRKRLGKLRRSAQSAAPTSGRRRTSARR